MPSYIAFLRALNIGKRVYKMADLRALLHDAGLEEVETYIQTGNVSFSTPLRSREEVERHVEEILASGCGFEVSTIAFLPQELRRVYDDARGLDAPLPEVTRRYVTLLKQPADPGAAAPIEGWDVEGERVAVRGRAVHWWLAKPTHRARLSNARIEKALGTGTTRNLDVLEAVVDRWAR